jgi:DNA-binding transcriptional LysR family regulator
MGAFQDLSLLNAFVCIVESGSVSAGARRLKTPQPTASRYLRALEDECGAILLRRDTHGMSLTETGRRVLADARMMLAFAEDAEQRLRDDQQELHGPLRLFANIDFGQFTYTRLISSFLQINPKVTVELGYNNRPLHMIQEGCDAGLIVGDLTDDSVVARSAGKVARYLVASPAFVKGRPAVKQPSDLKSWPWLALAGAQFGGSKTVTLFHEKRSNQTLRISPVLISEGVTSLREAARTGLGVSVLPDWLAKEDLVSGRLVRVLPSWRVGTLPVHIVYSSQRMLPVRVRAFIDYSIAYMTAELRES